MECIKYINDLTVEIEMLNQMLNQNLNNNKYYEIKKIIDDKIILLEKCKENLEKLSSNQIEYKIYLNILNGLSVSKAIEKVADENYEKGISPSSKSALWRNYYPKLKKMLNV